MKEDIYLKILSIIFIIGILIGLFILAFNNEEVDHSDVHDTCIVYRNELYCRVELYE